MKEYGGDYWSWYKMPVPIRVWFVNKAIERIKAANKGKSDVTKPLSNSEKTKYTNDINKMQNDPSKMKTMFNPTKK